MTFCPQLTIKQFIAIVSIIDVILYIASVAYKGIGSTGFLAPTNEALFDFGEKVCPNKTN